MKLYSFYTPSHRILKEHWFVPSLKDDYELIFEEWPQICPSGEFMKSGWIETMHCKVDLILRAIKENWDDVFVFSDVDVQFFSPTKEILLELMDGKDMVIQRNDPPGNLCTGFFACRATDRTFALWREIKDSLGQENKNEEDLLNHYLRNRKNRSNVHWSYLPDNFFGGGIFSGKRWKPGMDLIIPDQPIMHHANWTVGVDHKMAQLEHVRNQVMKKPFAMRYGIESRR